MYKLIFYFFYRYFVNKDDRSPKFGAACCVLVVIGLHILLAYAIIQRIVGHTLIEPLSKSYYWSKSLNMALILPFFVVGLFYFNKKRTDRLIGNYENKNVFTFFNWAIFLIMTLGALLSIIFILRK